MTGRSDPSSASHHDPSGQGSSAAGPTPTRDDQAPEAGERPESRQAAPALGNAAAAFIAAGRDAAPRRPSPAIAGGSTGRTAPETAADAPLAWDRRDETVPKPPPRPGGTIVPERPDDQSVDAPDVPVVGHDAPEEPGSSPDPLKAPALSQDAPGAPEAGAATSPEPQATGFRLRLSNFEGPFDLLLTLISSRKLDVTEVALHKVTDEFIAYTKALTANMARQNTLRADKILDQTTEFLVVAATLLDLKAARLLPSGEMTDAEDLELLEARDLLFARLLQYRAFKQVAELLGELEAAALRRYPRAVGLEERYAGLLPEVRLGVGAAEFAAIAAAAFRPRPVPKVGLDHLHTHAISVAEQAALVLERLKQRGAGAWTSFGELVADCEVPVQIVARFLALLELYRGKTIEFDQPDPLGPLSVSWIGDDAAQQVETVTIEEDYG